MTYLKKLTQGVIGAIAAISMVGAALAADFGPPPSEAAAARYIKGRLANTRGAQVRAESGPYRVVVETRRREVAGWALDVSVRMRLSGGRRGIQDYTVIFVNGRAVALDEDDIDYYELLSNKIVVKLVVRAATHRLCRWRIDLSSAHVFALQRKFSNAHRIA